MFDNVFAAIRSCALALSVGKIALRCCYVSVYFLLFCVGFQQVTRFNKNNACLLKLLCYICSIK